MFSRFFSNSHFKLAILTFLMCGVFAYTAHPADWFLVYANFLIIFIFPEILRDWRMAALFLGAILLRESFSGYNYFIDFIPSADMDSAGFEQAACYVAQHSDFELHLGADFFTHCIAVLYRWFGCSGFLSSQITQMAMTGFAIVLLKMTWIIGYERYRYWILFFTLYLPSHVLFSSLNLREPFQLFFLAAAILPVLRLRFDESASVRKAVLVFLFNVGMLGVMHNGLMFYSIAILGPLSILYCLKRLPSLHKILLFICITGVLFPVLGYFSTHSVRGSHVISKVLSGEIVDYVNFYRDHLPLGRTQYDAKFDFSSPGVLLSSTFEVLAHFWFEPFPNRVETMSDRVVFLEVQCYLLLLIGSVITWVRSKGLMKTTATYFLAIYVSLSLLWASGTGNVGTAIRHQMTITWILMLFGVPGLAALGRKLKSELQAAIYKPVNSVIASRAKQSSSDFE